MTGAVVGGFAATVDLKNGGGQGVLIAEGGLITSSPDGVDGFVFEKVDGFLGGSIEHLGDGVLLEFEAVGVGQGLVEGLDLHDQSMRDWSRALRLDLASVEDFGTKWVGDLQVGQADGEGIGGIVRWCLRES